MSGSGLPRVSAIALQCIKEGRKVLRRSVTIKERENLDPEKRVYCIQRKRTYFKCAGPQTIYKTNIELSSFRANNC